jgi:hypothetical protein
MKMTINQSHHTSTLFISEKEDKGNCARISKGLRAGKEEREWRR